MGGIWRRWLGGWLGGHRSVQFLVAPLLVFPLFLGYDWVVVGFSAVVLTFSWVMGHEWTKPIEMVGRYSYCPIILSLFISYYTDSLLPLVYGGVGILVSLAYWLCQRKTLQPVVDWTGGLFNRVLPCFYDGPIALAEFLAGFIVYELGITYLLLVSS